MRRLMSALVLSLALPGPAAADPLSVFAPAQVRALAVSAADARALHALPPLDAFGTVRGTRSPALEEAESAADLARSAGFALRLPAALPAGVPGGVRYEIAQRARTRFRFSAAKAAAWAAAHHVALTPLPAHLDGTTFTGTLGPVALVTYGTPPKSRREARGARRGSFLVIAQAPLPAIESDGAPPAALVRWMTQQPGVPPHLAAQVRALGDAGQTLPIPIRVDRQTAAGVRVDGVQGLAIGDETGIGSAVVWTRDGRVYALAGTLTQHALLALANALP